MLYYLNYNQLLLVGNICWNCQVKWVQRSKRTSKHFIESLGFYDIPEFLIFKDFWKNQKITFLIWLFLVSSQYISIQELYHSFSRLVHRCNVFNASGSRSGCDIDFYWTISPWISWFIGCFSCNHYGFRSLNSKMAWNVHEFYCRFCFHWNPFGIYNWQVYLISNA